MTAADPQALAHRLDELADSYDDHAVIETSDPRLAEHLRTAARLLDAMTPPPPDQAIETARLTVTAYITENGSNRYAVHARGDVPMTSYLGLATVAQDEILRWRNEP